jgi:hypothetical protein
MQLEHEHCTPIGSATDASDSIDVRRPSWARFAPACVQVDGEHEARLASRGGRRAEGAGMRAPDSRFPPRSRVPIVADSHP